MMHADTIVRLQGLPRVPAIERRHVLVAGEHDAAAPLRSVARTALSFVRRLLGAGPRVASAPASHEDLAQPGSDTLRAELARVRAGLKDMDSVRATATADHIREEMTLARLERVMELATSAGIEVHAVPLLGGRIGIAVDGAAMTSPAAESVT